MEDKLMRGVAYGVMGFAGLMIMVGLLAHYSQAATPYCCPICGQCFATLAELEAHFEAEHPGEPIDIIWES